MVIPAGAQHVYTDDPGTMTATWIDPTGTEWPLTTTDLDVGWFTRPGPAGWGAVKYEVVTDPMPRGGETVRFIRSQAGRITWPLHVHGETYEGDLSRMLFVDRMRTIKRAIMMTVHRNKPGTLRVARGGTVREIDCYYEDGFGGEAGEDDLSANPVITFYCPDGYWRDPVAIVENRDFAAGVSFLAPFLTVSQGQVLGNSVITNPGDVDAWPVWTITGPADVVTAQNLTTGYQFVLTKTIAAGEMIIITTDRPTVHGPLGENLVGSLNLPDAYLWPLIPDNNEVNFNVSGAAAGTKIQLSFNPRYEGA